MSAAALRTLPDGFTREAEAVAIGASAGGVDALLQMMARLPASYPLPVVVVLHLPENRDSLLAEVFGNRCAIAVREAADKEPLAPGTLYFAPAGYHLLLEADRSFSLSCDAPEHFSRPSIDVMMESAADVFGAGLAGVLLTGANEDGAAGLARIVQAGGLAVVQDPDEAQVPDMPLAALARTEPDFILRLAEIQALIANLKPPRCPPSSS
jgi:two-component system, chemotaxis family, protein-glutamate methylesterase/glutaminase